MDAFDAEVDESGTLDLSGVQQHSLRKTKLDFALPSESDVVAMDADALCSALFAKLHLTPNTLAAVRENAIDGEAFLSMEKADWRDCGITITGDIVKLARVKRKIIKN